jgi:hypothetical protein
MTWAISAHCLQSYDLPGHPGAILPRLPLAGVNMVRLDDKDLRASTPELEFWELSMLAIETASQPDFRVNVPLSTRNRGAWMRSGWSSAGCDATNSDS